MRSSPPFCVNSVSSLMISRSPLHLMKETIISMRSQETISFFSSVYICGSCAAPVKSELCAIDVPGRTISARASTAWIVFFVSSSANNCSARSATDIPSNASSLVSLTMVDTMRFTSSTWEFRPPPLSFTFSSPRSTISATYLARTLAASASSIGAV